MELPDYLSETIRYIRWYRSHYGVVYPVAVARRFNISIVAATKRLKLLQAFGIIRRDPGRMKPIIILKKRCSCCKRWLDETPDHFQRIRGGLRSRCKACSQADFAKRYRANPTYFYSCKRASQDKKPEHYRALWRAQSARYRLNNRRRRIQEIARRIAA